MNYIAQLSRMSHSASEATLKPIRLQFMPFSMSGATVWNALPDYLRNPTLSIDVFKRYLKTFLFAQY